MEILILVIIKLKKYLLKMVGTGYKNAGDDGFEVKIVGDGTGGRAVVEVGTDTKISDVQVSVEEKDTLTEYLI